jgi:hypothetical protein
MTFTKLELDLLCVLVEQESLRIEMLMETLDIDATSELKFLAELDDKLEKCYNVDNSL